MPDAPSDCSVTMEDPSTPRLHHVAPPLIGERGVQPSPGIASLPWILRAPIMYFYVDILRPDDQFISVLRKLVITVGMLLSFAPAIVAIYNIVTIDDNTSPAALVAKIVVFFYFFAWMIPYLLVRFSADRDELGADIWVFGTWLLLNGHTIAFIDWPSSESFVLLAVVAQLFRTRLLPLQLVCCFCSHVLYSYNRAAYSVDNPVHPLAALPGAVMRGFDTRLLFSITSLLTAVCVLTALQLQLMESDRQTQVSKASADVAQEVAEYFGQYDTRSAKHLLDDARKDNTCNPELLQSLQVLLDNLDKYRPHLPNWLLPQSSDDDREAGERFGSPHTSHDNTSTDQRSNSSRASRASRASHASHGSGRGHGRFVDGGWLAPCVAQTAQISMAYIEYAFTNKDRAQEAANEWVQWVHREAAATSGAVHSFVGDVVVMSWNAASRAIQNEVKAARLLARAAVYGRDNGVALSGAAMSGTARVQLAGGERMQALTIHAGWKRVATEPLLKLARDTKAMLVDHRTRSNSHFGIRYRAACAMTVREASYGDDGSGETVHRVGAFEVMGEANDDGDEWMYVLQRNGDTTQNAVSQHNQALVGALHEWARREDAQALDLLTAVTVIREPSALPELINALVSRGDQS